MKMLNKFLGPFIYIAQVLKRLGLFIYNNRKLFGIITIFYAGMIAGEYKDLLNTFLGRNFDGPKVGQNVRVSGDCLLYNGARVTLTNDQLRVIKKDKERIYGVIVELTKAVSCLRENVVIDPYTYAQFLLDGQRPILKIDEKRTAEADPELALVKKTVLLSGLCNEFDPVTKKLGKARNLSSNLAEILSVEGDFERVYNVFLVVQSKTLRCESKHVKSRLVKDEDVSTFEEDEKTRMTPRGPVDLVGKMVEVTGSCKLINPANKKELSLHFREQPVFVLNIEKEGDVDMVLRGSTAYDQYDAVPIACDRRVEPDVFWKATDKVIGQANSEPHKSQILTITGACQLEDGSSETLFEQKVKVSEIVKSDGANIDKVVGYIKIKNAAKVVTCDKKKDKTLQFDNK